MRTVLIYLIFVLLGCWWVWPVLSAQEVTPKQADAICYDYAGSVYQIANLRDLGVPKDQLVVAINDMDAPAEVKATLQAQIDLVYEYANVPAIKLASGIYDECLKYYLEVEA